MFENESIRNFDKNSALIISPDVGGMERAIYYANVLGLDVGLFYKRRDYSRVVNGKNPIVRHEYLGTDVSGKDVLIVDDMLASGETILDIALKLKERNVKDIYVAVTFALFTEGVKKFDDYCSNGIIKKLYSTNLTYVPDEIKGKGWYGDVDMSTALAYLVDRINYDESITSFFDSAKDISQLKERVL